MSAAHFEDRFSDWVPLDFPGQPIFAGDQVTNRMAQLRQKIEEVRTQWNNRSRFIDSLQRRILSAGVTGCEREIMENNCRRLFSTTKDWADTDMGYTPSGFEDMDFSAITLYSSVLGYDKLFKAFNSHLRQGDILANEGLVRDVVFLVELMRIELYNYRFANWGNSKISNFEGTVYRGVPLKLEDVAHFRNASQGPLKTRVMSIPLSFMSSSTDPKRAEDFAAATAAQGLVPFQFIIHVRGIDRDLFSWYSEKYPESIVTSICAVPIARLSEVSKEKEVLLGGAFFQILQFSEEPYTVELVMLNSNRDHQTAHASNKGRDKTMRTDFTTIVLISRSEVCAALAEERNLPDMAREYRQWATELRAQLDLQESPKRELAAVTILGTEWPARTLAKPISAPQRHKRVRYSDAAASGNWNTVFNIINEEYEWQKHEWVNFSSPRSSKSRRSAEMALPRMLKW